MNMFFNIADAAASLAAFIAVIIAIVQRRHDVKHDRRQATLNAYNQLQNEALDRLYMDFTPAQVKAIAEHPFTEENRQTYYLLGTYLARIEHFCVGVVTDIYDRETVYELSNGFLNGSIKSRIQPLIERKEALADSEPYENTKKVLAMLDREAADKRNR